MARVKYSALISSMSGSIGSATFQNTRAGSIIRNRPRSSKNPSATQLLRRSTMMQLHYAWQDLTDDERYAWNKFIDFSGASIRRDKSIKLTGHGLFLKYNFLRLLTGRSIYTTVYYNPLPEIPVITLLEVNPVTMVITFDGSLIGSEIWFVLKLTSARPESQNFNTRGLRWISAFFNANTTFFLSDPYKAAFGFIPPAGAFVHYSIQWFSLDSPVISGKQIGTWQLTS